MGEIIKQLKNKAGSAPASGGSHAPHTADYLYAKHLFSQGLGPDPDASTATNISPAAGGSGGVAVTPPGGMVDVAEEIKRRNVGVQL